MGQPPPHRHLWLCFCLILSFVAEHYFGIADITGAYFAGLILCNIMEAREYINKKMTVLGYMIFSPIFFASIGIKTELDGMTASLLVFSVALLMVAILTKIVGCGLAPRSWALPGRIPSRSASAWFRAARSR